MAASAPPLLQYINEHVLECAICTEPFKEPKSLPCLHVFCKGCIKTYFQRNKKGKQYSCPTCQEVHYLANTAGGVDSLRDAFLQKSLLEVSNLIQKKTVPCTSCETGSAAKCACATCGDFLCEECQATHKTLRPFRGHTLTFIDELGDVGKLADFQRMRYDSCALHAGEQAKLFCKTDETEVCNMCTFDPQHKDHDVIPLTNKFREFDADIKRVKKDINKHIQGLQGQKKRLTEALG